MSDKELANFMSGLVDKYKRQVPIMNFVLILVLGVWINAVASEQQRRTVPVDAMQSVLIKSLTHNEQSGGLDQHLVE